MHSILPAKKISTHIIKLSVYTQKQIKIHTYGYIFYFKPCCNIKMSAFDRSAYTVLDASVYGSELDTHIYTRIDGPLLHVENWPNVHTIIVGPHIRSVYIKNGYSLRSIQFADGMLELDNLQILNCPLLRSIPDIDIVGYLEIAHCPFVKYTPSIMTQTWCNNNRPLIHWKWCNNMLQRILHRRRTRIQSVLRPWLIPDLSGLVASYAHWYK